MTKVMGQTNNMIYNLVGKAGFNKEAPMLDAFLHQIPTSIFDLSPYFLQLEPFIFFLLSFMFRSAHYIVHSLFFLFLCSFPPISVRLKLCHSSYITQQSSRARLVTTNNQPLPGRPPPHSPLQWRPPQSSLATKPAVIAAGRLNALTGGNANFLQI